MFMRVGTTSDLGEDEFKKNEYVLFMYLGYVF